MIIHYHHSIDLPQASLFQLDEVRLPKHIGERLLEGGDGLPPSPGRDPHPATAEDVVYCLAGEGDPMFLFQSTGDVRAGALSILLLVVANDELLYPVSRAMAIPSWPIEKDREIASPLKLLVAAQVVADRLAVVVEASGSLGDIAVDTCVASHLQAMANNRVIP